MEPQQGGEIFQIVFLMVTQIPLALVVYGWGKRMESGNSLSIVLTLIPGIGYFYFYWFAYKTVRYLLDKVSER